MSLQTMKLVYQPDPASQDLIFSSSSPVPKLTDPDDHLVRVKAASPCRHELLWEATDTHLFDKGRTPPRVPCPDGAGVIVTAPTTNSPFQPGDEVFFSIDYTSRAGCLAEYTIVKTGEMALKPKTFGWPAAAAAPLSALTAWQGLFIHGNLAIPSSTSQEENAGKRILVTGAAGSVGSWVVQLAEAAGVTSITGVCSESKLEMAKSFGATDVLSYSSFSIASPNRYDLILDTVGGNALRDCWSVIKADVGVLLAVGSDYPENVRPEGAPKVAKSEWYLVKQSRDDLEAVAALVDQGKGRAMVDSEYAMEDYKAAFEKVSDGRPNGKVVINIS
uniref:Enoyl reductase (ER) domain-containing protein n=1 Tax=Bionectria ochroleuca TaxID=29856 RepID=A0A8H7K9R4_BIOOC